MNKINEIRDTIKYCPNRCYSMALNLVKKVGKEADALYFVKGTNHYWLETADGQIIDLYADAICESYDYDAIRINRVPVSQIRTSIRRTGEWRWGGRNEDERVNVWDLPVDLLNRLGL